MKQVKQLKLTQTKILGANEISMKVWKVYEKWLRIISFHITIHIPRTAFKITIQNRIDRCISAKIRMCIIVTYSSNDMKNMHITDILIENEHKIKSCKKSQEKLVVWKFSTKMKNISRTAKSKAIKNNIILLETSPKVWRNLSYVKSKSQMTR